MISSLPWRVFGTFQAVLVEQVDVNKTYIVNKLFYPSYFDRQFVCDLNVYQTRYSLHKENNERKHEVINPSERSEEGLY